MNRRDVLKLGGISSLLLAFPTWKLAEFTLATDEAEFNGRVYRGAQDGTIQVSADKRQTWNKHADFGARYPISKMFIGMDRCLYAQVDYQGRDFFLLLSADEKSWRVG